MRFVSTEAPARDGALPVSRAALFDKGLKVVIQEAHTSPVILVWCWYRLGSKDELPGFIMASIGTTFSVSPWS